MDEAIANVIGLIAGQGVPAGILVYILWFISRQIWPFYTDVYVPGKRQHEIRTLELINSISKHLENQSVALEALVGKFASQWDREDTLPP